MAAQAKGQAQLVGDYPLGLDLAWTLTLPAASSSAEEQVQAGIEPAPVPEPAREPASDPDRESDPCSSGGGASGGPTRQAQPITLTGTGKISGDLASLKIEHSIAVGQWIWGWTAPDRCWTTPAWDARLDLRRVDLPAFDPSLPAVDLRGGPGERRGPGPGQRQGAAGGQGTGAAADSVPGLLVADLDLTGPDETLTIRTLKVTEDVSGAKLDAGGEVVLASDPGRFDVQVTWEQLRWPLSGDLLVEARTGKLSAAGAFDDYHYSLTGDVAGPDIPAATLNLAGTGTDKGTQIGKLRLDTMDGYLDAKGDVAWDPAPRWDLKLTAKDIDPGTLVPDLPARISFEAESAGTLDGYDLNLTGETGGPALPTALIGLAATGDLQSAKLQTLRLDTLGGRIEAQGQGAWDPQPSWDLSLSAEGIDPSKHWPEWPGRLGGRVLSKGQITEEGPDLSAELDGIKGELRGYPVAAVGKVRVQGETVTLDEVVASSGPSKARVSGTVGEELGLTFAVTSPDLKSLLPDAQGSIEATGTVAGSVEAPEVKLKLGAKGVQVAGQGIESLSGDVDLGLGPAGRFDVRLVGKNLAAGGLTWQDIQVRGDGSMADHRLSADLKGEPLSVRLKASGALKADNAYQGSLAELELTSKAYGQWGLERPAPIALALPKVSAGPLCLRDRQGGDAGRTGGCVRFEQVADGKWNADLDLDRLALARLGPFLPSDMTLVGAGSLKGRFAADGPVLTGNAALSIPKGQMSLVVGTETEILDFSATRLTLDSGSKGLSAKLDLPLAGIGGANANVTLAGWRLDNPARLDQPLAGRVQARVTDFKRVGHLVPDLTAITGTLDLDLGLSGNLGRPGVKGGGKLAGVGFDVPLIGLTVRNLNLNADSVGANHIVYKGGLDLGGGSLAITGDSMPEGAGAWVTKVRIAGERLKVADSKQYFALVSPDLNIQIGPAGLDLGGEVRVPEARIRPRVIPAGTVSPSSDVIIEEAGYDEGAPRAEPFPISANLRLVLGDAVSIDAFGLRGLLRGDLRVIKAPGREPLGDGQVSVVDGSYRLSGGLGLMAAVGKPLTVEQGILVFAKTPLSNPGLLLTAQREGGDVTAGVRVLGTIKKPKLAFFSESDPDMSPSEITSYLVTGVPPRKGNAEDAGALAVGTYISPKLYMEYESNLGDAADKIKLRYELTNRIELQTETGDGQGADVFYKFEN